MKAKFDLPQPGNWILFEELCLKVWGFIWNVPDRIDYNSTNSQGQDGVDIICTPKGETGLFGIQCKNKRLILKTGESNKITKSIIDDEVNKARHFDPPLKHLVIATSLYRDKEIENYVRNLSAANTDKGLFSIQIAFWDFIADRIQDYPALTNWYLNGQGLAQPYGVTIKLDNNEDLKVFNPEYVKEVHKSLPITSEEYQEEILKVSESWTEASRYIESNRSFLEKMKDWFQGLFQKRYSGEAHVSLIINGVPADEIFPRASIKNFQDRRIGYELKPGCFFRLVMTNTGQQVIEDFKLRFSVNGEFTSFDIVGPTVTEALNKRYQNHSFKSSGNVGLFEPEKAFIVQGDQLRTYKFYVKPLIDRPSLLELEWTLTARDFSDKGKLKLDIQPVYKNAEKIWYIRSDEKPYEEIKYCYDWINESPKPNL
jgi:hypothetical protein